MDKDLELQRIKEAVQTILDRNFPKYLEDMKKHWPNCYRCKQPMCQVLKKGETTFFQCFGRSCGHKEWSI
jgi:hypothetical protein